MKELIVKETDTLLTGMKSNVSLLSDDELSEVFGGYTSCPKVYCAGGFTSGSESCLQTYCSENYAE